MAEMIIECYVPHQLDTEGFVILKSFWAATNAARSRGGRRALSNPTIVIFIKRDGKSLWVKGKECGARKWVRWKRGRKTSGLFHRENNSINAAEVPLSGFRLGRRVIAESSLIAGPVTSSLFVAFWTSDYWKSQTVVVYPLSPFIWDWG